MINVNQITAQLARMPDQALQQFAAMHKNDPYTVSLALSESNRRKQMRSAAQGQQGMGEQPKVVDQGIAEMAPPAAQPMPEDVGIGQLPAGNMNFAEGGIVAFADGGDVPRYADEGLVRLPNESFADFRRRTFDMELKRQREANLATEQAREAERMRLLAERGDSNTVPPSPFFERAPLPSSVGATVSTMPTQGFTRPGMVSDPRLAPGFAGVSSTAPVTDTGRGAAPGASPGIDQLLAPRAGAGSRAPAASNMDFAEQYTAIRSKLKDEDKYAPMIAERNRLAKEMGIERAEAFEKDVASRGDVDAKREARLLKRGEDITKQGETNTGLALLNAGLAMMSTPGGLATAIGKGARVGTEQFAAGLEKINRSKELLSDAQDRADELKAAREELTMQQRRAIKNDINKDVLAAQDLAIAGARDAGAKNDKVAADIFKEAGAMQRTQIQAAATRDAAATRGAGGAGLAGERLDVTRLTAQAKILQDQLKANPPYGKTKERNAQLQQALDAINIQLGGGTIPAPSAAAAPGGTQAGWGIRPLP